MLDTSNFSVLDVLEISECSVYFLLRSSRHRLKAFRETLSSSDNAMPNGMPREKVLIGSLSNHESDSDAKDDAH